MIKVIEVERDGVVYKRCSECDDNAEKFRSTTKIPFVKDGKVLCPQLRYSAFNGLNWAFSNGFKLKRFTIVP